jgi:hypothetical protein
MVFVNVIGVGLGWWFVLGRVIVNLGMGFGVWVLEFGVWVGGGWGVVDIESLRGVAVVKFVGFGG